MNNQNQGTEICPLTGYGCAEDRCKIWNFAGRECAIVSAADALQDISTALADIVAARGDEI